MFLVLLHPAAGTLSEVCTPLHCGTTQESPAAAVGDYCGASLGVTVEASPRFEAIIFLLCCQDAPSYVQLIVDEFAAEHPQFVGQPGAVFPGDVQVLHVLFRPELQEGCVFPWHPAKHQALTALAASIDDLIFPGAIITGHPREDPEAGRQFDISTSPAIAANRACLGCAAVTVG